MHYKFPIFDTIQNIIITFHTLYDGTLLKPEIWMRYYVKYEFNEAWFNDLTIANAFTLAF